MSAETERERIHEDYNAVLGLVRTEGSDDTLIRDKRIPDDPTIDAFSFSFVDGDVTVANPGVIEEVGHGLNDHQGPFRLANVGGALPTGYLAATNYWVRKINDDTFSLAIVRGGPGVEVFAAEGGGVHTLTAVGQAQQRDAGNAGGDSKAGHWFPIASTETDEVYA